MKLIALLFSSALMGLALCTSSQAVIVPQHSIAGARIGMTETQVRAKLGSPLRLRSGSNLFGHWRQLTYRYVTVSFQSGNKVTGLMTKSASEQTASGVRVGWTLAKLRAGLNSETCRREFGVHHCWIGKWEPGHVISDFRLKRNRVSMISIGYVFD
ncbi:MAG: hypothetical protein IMZ71_01345 [Chloroflexi bacterium]|nr:hypothetical protein [Chloroflexota bacterium]